MEGVPEICDIDVDVWMFEEGIGDINALTTALNPCGEAIV